MIKAVSSSVMKLSDEYTVKNITSAAELMKRAGEEIYKRLPEASLYAVVCGGGNNGGDGFVIALCLHESGKDVTVYTLSEKFTPESRLYYEKCVNSGVKIVSFTAKLSRCDVVVDCIFGTGLNKEPCGIYAEAVKAINNSGAYIVSADINSGLYSDSGQYSLCVKSDLTVAVGEYKAGHFLGGAKDVIKSLDCADIGIKLIGKPYMLCEAEDFSSVFPPRKQNSHKGTYRTSAVFGGCLQYSGAVKLCNLSLSELKCGCGISKVIVPEGIACSVAPYLLESTLCTVPGDKYAVYDEQGLQEALRGVSSLALGMGWGRSSENERILSYILKSYDKPLVIDADGLFALASLGDYVSNGQTVLTPHPAEFSRLCGLTVEAVLQNPIETAVEYAKRHNVTLLLKGSCTVITDGERVYLVNRGAPGMATAGSGDVLSGIIAGINAQNPDDLTLNAAAGAWIAGVAGEYAQNECTAVSMTSSDTVRNIHKAVAMIYKD